MSYLYKITSVLVFYLSCITFSPLAQANFHFWDIHSIYSNADGSIQYIQLVTAADGQSRLVGEIIESRNSDGSLRDTFTFINDISVSTMNRFLLLATPGFAALSGGIEPDFEIPVDFLSTDGGTVNFLGAGSFVYTAAQLVKNGSQALGTVGLIPSNPFNFLEQRATINESAIASYDSVTQIARLPVVDIPSNGVYNVELQVISASPLELQVLSGFYKYEGDVTTDSNSAVFTGGVLTVPAIRIGANIIARELDIINTSFPFTFGNVRAITVPDETPMEPEPDPGQTLFLQLCASCHCPTGGGGCFPLAPSLITTPLGSSFAALSDFIDSLMPRGNAGACIGECADDVANYIIETFQSSSASELQAPTGTPDEGLIGPYGPQQ